MINLILTNNKEPEIVVQPRLITGDGKIIYEFEYIKRILKEGEHVIECIIDFKKTKKELIEHFSKKYHLNNFDDKNLMENIHIITHNKQNKNKNLDTMLEENKNLKIFEKNIECIDIDIDFTKFKIYLYSSTDDTPNKPNFYDEISNKKYENKEFSFLFEIKYKDLLLLKIETKKFNINSLSNSSSDDRSSTKSFFDVDVIIFIVVMSLIIILFIIKIIKR